MGRLADSIKRNRAKVSAVVLAVPGTKGYLFPDQRPEMIEFLSYVEDEKGRPCVIKCTVRDYSEVIEKALDELGIAQKARMTQKPEMELELFPDKLIH